MTHQLNILRSNELKTGLLVATAEASPLLPGRSDHVTAPQQKTSAALCLIISLAGVCAARGPDLPPPCAHVDCTSQGGMGIEVS
jgi:hypothetical protein